mmetsp:Transcript_18231/g.42220  ORF Transcript_18231/g.42220 Transcript_18231/m.42220 type:complete len:152 (+) Transcript_18231:535-990(+)
MGNTGTSCKCWHSKECNPRPIPNTFDRLFDLDILDLTSNPLQDCHAYIDWALATALENLFLADIPSKPRPIPREYRTFQAPRDFPVKDTRQILSEQIGSIPTWFGDLESLIYWTWTAIISMGPSPWIGLAHRLAFPVFESEPTVRPCPLWN